MGVGDLSIVGTTQGLSTCCMVQSDQGRPVVKSHWTSKYHNTYILHLELLNFFVSL